jgi:hypothetical protein
MLQWFVTNLDGLVAAALAIHAAAVAVVNLTPTPKDDAIVAKVYRVIEIIAGIFTAKAKQ